MFKNETKIGYSLALLDIAKEEKKLKEIYNQSNLIISILEKEPEFEKILDSFGIDEKTKQSIIKKTFKDFHWSLLNTMQMLSIKNQFRHFKDILNKLNKYIEDILKIKNGIIYSTKPISKIELKKIEQKVSEEQGCEITLKNLIDKELIGGFRIEIGSDVIEDSVKSELQSIKKSLNIKKGGV